MGAVFPEGGERSGQFSREENMNQASILSIFLALSLLFGTAQPIKSTRADAVTATNGTIERIAVSNEGVQGDDWSMDPSVSGDGRFVAFESTASNLVPGD